MTDVSRTAGPVVPARAFIQRALVDWAPLYGFMPALAQSTISPGGGPWTLKFTSYVQGTNRHGLESWFKDVPVQFFWPSKTLVAHWDQLRDCVNTEGTVLMHIGVDRAHWDAFQRESVELRLDAMGAFRVVRENWLAPARGEAWLVTSALPSQMPEVARAGALLERLVRFHGGPRVSVTARDVTPKGQPMCPLAMEVRIEVPPPAPATVELAQLEELVVSLSRALREAPRGFVGLKHFRDRILLPMASGEIRQFVLDVALDRGIVLVRNVTDPKTGGLTAALELNSTHPIVRATT